MMGTLEYACEDVVAFMQDRLTSRNVIIGKTLALAPDVIWISVLPTAINVVKFIKNLRTFTQAPIVLGNIGARVIPLEIIASVEKIFIVKGQGEDAVYSLAHYFKNDKQDDVELALIPNLIWASSNNEIIENIQQPAKLADKIVPGSFGLDEAINRQDVISARSSSGCVGCCTFCTVKVINNGQSWKCYPIARLEQWLEKVIQAGGKDAVIILVDDNMADNINNLYDVANIFVKLKNKYAATLKYSFSARADCLVQRQDTADEALERRRIWKYALDAGLETVFLGLESGSETQLKRFGKKMAVRNNYEAFNIAKSLGINVDIGFIPVDPLMEENSWRAEMLDNVKLARYCDISKTSPTWLAPLRVYKDSHYYTILSKKGLLGSNIPESEEYCFEYKCSDVKLFIQDLGPVFCEGSSNGYYDFKRQFKNLQRYPIRYFESFVKDGESIFNDELVFVENLLQQTNKSDVLASKLQFIKAVSQKMQNMYAHLDVCKANYYVPDIQESVTSAIGSLTEWRRSLLLAAKSMVSQKFIVGVAAIIKRNNLVLALRRSMHKDAAAGVWEGVSGKVELDEDPLQALHREIQEECRLNVIVDAKPLSLLQTKRKDEPMILIIYQADYISGDVILSSEHEQCEWITPEEFKERTVYSTLGDLALEVCGKSN
ncbi:MAG: NUDIX domain-containing protein [Gammaproteobacteria bacterium]|nr:NUDIX domain-containing protein [Gammaproteobacteria bacterium]